MGKTAARANFEVRDGEGWQEIAHNCPVKPKRNYIVVVRLMKDKVRGLWMPDTAKEVRTIGVVLKVGPDVKNAEPGEIVIFQYGTCEIRPEGNERQAYDIMTDEAVLASLEL